MTSTAALYLNIGARATVRRVGERWGALGRYFLLSYAAVLVNAVGFLRLVDYDGVLTYVFAAAVFLTYSFLYLLPAFILPSLLEGMFRLPGLRRVGGDGARAVLMYGLAVLGTTLLQVLLYVDRFVFQLYGFHFNGFVWNLIFTRGGLESLGGTHSSFVSFAIIVAVLLAVQVVLLAVAIGIAPVRLFLSRFLKIRRIALALGLFAAATLFERATYGICNLRGYRPVLAASSAFPLYMPTTLTKLAQKFGVEVVRRPSLDSEISLGTSYPKHPIVRRPDARPPNIVWLVSESLRADMVDPEIMPHAWKLAQQAVWCRQHYSGGNGTRMGMFSMFYGLYGCFWFPIFEAQRAPILMDVLQQAGYQMEMFTSASFTYPEFDRTMFVNVPADKLHEARTMMPWRRDQENVTDLLKFVDGCDPARPFMTFMFFESPHSPYHFPKDAVIRKDYLEDLNYAQLDEVAKFIGPIKSRYINACHHLDMQLGRILAHLQERQLMESTIVLFTGDHGEEFMEHGRWGHNSEFTEEQTRPPLVLWIPGAGHKEITSMTSHLDIPATLMAQIGVTNPPSDYSFGYDLLGPTARDFTVICDWDRIAYVNDRYKVVFPFNVYGFADQKISLRDDHPVTEMAAFTADHKKMMPRLMADLRSFRQ